MRSIPQLEKGIDDEALLHGKESRSVAKLKSILGLVVTEEDLNRGIDVSVLNFNNRESFYCIIKFSVCMKL
jgi:hypothetical protein